MDRCRPVSFPSRSSKPHVRGDGPLYALKLNDVEIVNPTCVGMDRGGWNNKCTIQSKPHVRGDGPFNRLMVV